MIEFCTQFTDQINKETGWNLTPEQAKENMRSQLQGIFTNTAVKAALLRGFVSVIPVSYTHLDVYKRQV